MVNGQASYPRVLASSAVLFLLDPCNSQSGKNILGKNIVACGGRLANRRGALPDTLGAGLFFCPRCFCFFPSQSFGCGWAAPRSLRFGRFTFLPSILLSFCLRARRRGLLSLGEPAFHVAVGGRSKIPIYDFLISGIAFVALSLPEGGVRCVECLLSGLAVLGPQRLERLHRLAGRGCEFKIVPPGKKIVDPVFSLLALVADLLQKPLCTLGGFGIGLPRQAFESLPGGLANRIGPQRPRAVERSDRIAGTSLRFHPLFGKIEQPHGVFGRVRFQPADRVADGQEREPVAGRRAVGEEIGR